MAQIVLKTPTVARLEGLENIRDRLRQLLAYTDRRVDFELNRARQSLRRYRGALRQYLIDKNGEEAYNQLLADQEAKVKSLQAQRDCCLLGEDQDGLWVPSGVAERLARELVVPVAVDYELPEASLLPWAKPPKFKNRAYQDEAVAALVEAAEHGPCGIELPTGAGKSVVIRDLVKHYGLPALIMAPSKSIANQLVSDLGSAFGSRYVGLFGDGKKQSDKHVVVGIDDSLAKVAPGSEHWARLSAKKVFIPDESHLVPANTLQRVCTGLMAAAPYRFFVSATQLRTDGLDLVLEGITGPIVYRKPLRELVDAGYLARPSFKMVRVKTQATLRVPDANRMTQDHLYYSPVVNRVAGDLVNQFVEVLKRPVLVLVDELEQFRHLAPHLRHEVRFAHGPLSAETKKLVPEAYHDCDVTKLVDGFNAGEFPVLVGTSCVATGTDLKAPEAVVYLMGGVSEIKVAQAVGRGTRGGLNGTPVLNPWTGAQKRDCVFVDFQVEDDGYDDQDNFAPYRHARLRAATYEQLYSAPDVIDMTGGSSLG